jgi:hypothetical protein
MAQQAGAQAICRGHSISSSLRNTFRKMSSVIRREANELRMEMHEAKRAAGNEGWWSDAQDRWPAEGHQDAVESHTSGTSEPAERPEWWYAMLDRWASDEMNR